MSLVISRLRPQGREWALAAVAVCEIGSLSVEIIFLTVVLAQVRLSAVPMIHSGDPENAR